jgi:hypothetical protein
MAGITVIEKSISVAKKIIEILKKNLKVVLDQTITPLTAMKPKRWKPKSNQTDLMNNRNRNHGTSH